MSCAKEAETAVAIGVLRVVHSGAIEFDRRGREAGLRVACEGLRSKSG